jgi:GDP-4-dehydro-6-deoxy-D-mannose reductase
MKRIAVTGANGFVGRHVVNELVSQDYDVLAIGGSNIESSPEASTVEYRSVDLLSTDEVKKLDFTGLDAVIHLAGLAAVGPSFNEPEHYMRTNTTIQRNLLDHAVEQHVFPRVLVISSGSLYDSSAPLPISEETFVKPSSPYATSKLAQEKEGLAYQEQGFEVMVARPFNHIGPGQNTGFLLPDLTSQIVQAERDGSNKILVGNLDAKRDYTDVRDIARAYRLLIETGTTGEIYNICSGTSHSGNELLGILLENAHVQIETVLDQKRMRPADTPDIYGIHDKLTAATGWDPTHRLENTVQDVLEDWRRR